MSRRRKRNTQAPIPQTPPISGVPVSADQPGMIDVKPMIAALKIPPQFKTMYDKVVLAGDNLMFGKDSHKLMLDELAKPGPMAPKLATGIASAVYILWNKSNKTIAPQILESVGYTLLLHAFDFLQKGGDPEATKEVLGEAAHQTSINIHNQLGVTEQQFNAAIAAHGGNRGA